jgi:site-specific DNA recombinase
MRKAILYIRVSTDEQADKGYSQNHQEERLRKFCEINGYVVVSVYREDYSAKTFNRPRFNELLTFLRKNKNKANLLVFTKWDRFSRNTADAYGMISTLEKLGVESQAIEQPLDLSIPENKIMLAFYLAAPEVENHRRSLNVFVGMRRAKKEGRWMGTAPKGYNNITTVEGKRIIVPNEDAPFLKFAFEQLATGHFHIDHVRRMCNEKGLICCKDNFWQLMKNPVYCGKIQVAAYKDEEFTIVKGNHEPIISEELFNHVQDVLAGRKRLPYSSRVKEEFPLRGFVTYPRCQKNLTASCSRGGSGNKHYYYHCIKGCPERIKAVVLHDSFLNILESITYDTNVTRLHEEITKHLTGAKNEQKAVVKLQDQAELKKNRDRLKNAEQMMLDGLITPAEYRDIKKRYELLIDTTVKKEASIGPVDSEFKANLKRGLCLLKNLPQTYLAADIKGRQSIIRSILAENLTISENGVRTGKLNSVFSLIASINGAYSPKKKRTIAKILQLSAREVPTRFELV